MQAVAGLGCGVRVGGCRGLWPVMYCKINISFFFFFACYKVRVWVGVGLRLCESIQGYHTFTP